MTDGELLKIGEVERFEILFSEGSSKILIGRNVTDFAFGEGDGEVYRAYWLDNGMVYWSKLPCRKVLQNYRPSGGMTSLSGSVISVRFIRFSGFSTNIEG